MYGLYGKVIKYVSDRRFGIILGDNKQTYIVLDSWLKGEQIEKGDCVFFVPFKNDRSNYNAKSVSVIYTSDKEVHEQKNTHKKKNNRKHKSCNADKVIRDDAKFQRFVRKFMREQRDLSRGEIDDGKTY